jgi:uncharacterized protein YprB with RNaseH-like and TPR domain
MSAMSRDEAGGNVSPELLERLSALGVVVGAAALEDARPRPRPDVTPIEAAVPGRSVENAHGACYVSDVQKALQERHGDEVLGHARQVSGEGLALAGGRPELADLDIERAAFLDTETTGLSGGTGTYAFLIGIGRFVGPTFQVRQFFMRDPSEEPAQLAEAADWVDGCTDLVTFNGRAYDMPLLETRYALRGVSAPLRGVRHLDLLPAARRLWRRRLSSCTLVSLERNILGLERQDDVPGWLIPHRYFMYQSDGDARPLVGIFHHNALDILSMVSLVTRVSRACSEPNTVLEHGLDWLSLARMFEVAGERDRVIATCEGALARDLSDDELEEAQRRLSLAAKRSGDWARATGIWLQMSGEQPPRSVFPFEELAKYYEHRVDPSELERALAYAVRARELVAERVIRPRRGTRTVLDELDHRIARLRRRVELG